MIATALILEQARLEGIASSHYLALAYWAELTGFPCMASWARRRSLADREQMKALLWYLTEFRGEEVTPPSLSVSSVVPESQVAALAAVVEMEVNQASQIQSLAVQALGAGDLLFTSWLASALVCQVQTVADLRGLLAQAERSSGDAAAESMVDYLFDVYPADPQA